MQSDRCNTGRVVQQPIILSFISVERRVLSSFDVQLCFESNDKLAQNLIIVYTITADSSSTIGRILSTVNHLPSITNKQVLNTCEKQTFITKVSDVNFASNACKRIIPEDQLCAEIDHRLA